jgi:hypothetical protein
MGATANPSSISAARARDTIRFFIVPPPVFEKLDWRTTPNTEKIILYPTEIVKHFSLHKIRVYFGKGYSVR